MAEGKEMEKVLALLRPYAANWSGTLGRGDLVIPQSEVPHLVQAIMGALTNAAAPGGEVSDAGLFEALQETHRSSSLQDQAAKLRHRFRIYKRPPGER